MYAKYIDPTTDLQITGLTKEDFQQLSSTHNNRG